MDDAAECGGEQPRRRGANAQQMKYVRKCKQLRAVEKFFHRKETRSRDILNTYKRHHAVRKSEAAGASGAKKVRGKGKWKTWTASSMLRASLGAAFHHRPGQRRNKIHDKLPSMFSVNSLAYWISSSTTHIAAVRNAISELWTSHFSDLVNALLDAKPSMIAMTLEFDASAIKTRLRTGLIEVDSVYHLLVQRGHIFVQKTPDATTLLQSAIPIAPSILQSESAENIWRAMKEKHPVDFWGWAKKCNVYILRFVCDAASANIKLFTSGALAEQPQNALLLQTVCAQHGLNHASEPLYRALGQLTPMFYCVGFLSSGTNLLNMLRHLEQWVLHDPMSVRVIFDRRPDPITVRRNRAMIEMILGPKSTTKPSARWRIAEELLSLDTGCWSSPVIHHHCQGVYCCKGGEADTRRKLWASIIALIFGIKPTTPAISRWTTCGATTKYFLCALAYHNVLQRGFEMMHSKQKLKDMKADFEEANTSVPASEYFASSVLPGASADLHRRAMGIRAWKAFAWLSKSCTLANLLLTTAAISPLEKVMHKFLKWQHESACLNNTCSSPTTMMCIATSPPRVAVDELLDLMINGHLQCITDRRITLQCLIEGFVGCVSETFTEHMFWAVISVVGQTWHRMVRPYTLPPWNLARLVAYEEPLESKQVIAQEFLSLNQCCLDTAFTAPLRRMIENVNDILPNGRHHALLRAAYQGLPFNVSVENCFARLKSMLKSGRGRADLSHSICSKHILAEIKKAHLEHLDYMEQNELLADSTTPFLQSLAGCKSKAYNGYSLFWSTAVASRQPLPGESNNECRVRTMNMCREQWKGSRELRDLWSAKAKSVNSESKAGAQAMQNIVAASNSVQRKGSFSSTSSSRSFTDLVHKYQVNADAVVCQQQQQQAPSEAIVAATAMTDDNCNRFPQLVVVPPQCTCKPGGFGPLGVGDSDWAVSEALVEQKEHRDGFVKTYSSAWKDRVGGMVADPQPFPSRTLRLSCLQAFGFCRSQIRCMEFYQHILGQLRQYVSNHRRLHVTGGRNRGPKVHIPHPLLVVKTCAQQDHQTDEVRSFILCRTKYSPYEGDWWEFRSRQREGPFVHQQWEASAHILTEGPIRSPVILSQTELARDLSNTLHLLAETPSRCFWSMIPYKVKSLSEVAYELPMSTSWNVVAQDSVMGSSEDEERTINCMSTFRKVAKCMRGEDAEKPSRQSTKKVIPGAHRKRKTQTDVHREDGYDELQPGEEHRDVIDLDEVADTELTSAWTNAHTAEHGQCVVRDGSRKDDAPKATATAASSSRQPESKACQAEFEVLDDLGCVLATQKPDGRVYKTGFAAPLGRITEFKIGRPGHSVSIACSTHRACRKVALIGHLPVSFQADAIRWLLAGHDLTNRADGPAHMALLPTMIDIEEPA